MDFSEDHNPVFAKVRLLDALQMLQKIASRLRRNNEVNPEFDESVHGNLLSAITSAARIFEDDLTTVSTENDPFNAEEVSKFLYLTYEVTSWIEIGLPEQQIFLANLRNLTDNFMNSYQKIYRDSEEAHGRISSKLRAPADRMEQLPPIMVPESFAEPISREPLVHMRSRLYAAELSRANETVVQIQTELLDAQTEIKGLRDELDAKLSTHAEAMKARTQELVQEVTSTVQANKSATDQIESNRKLLDRLASAATDDALTKHYSSFKTVNQNIYWAFFTLSVAALMLAAWFGLGYTLHWFGPLFPDENGLVNEDFIVTESIGRIVVISGLAGLGAFFAKQAGHYRKLAHWASSITVQLKTFDAYVKDIGDSVQRDQLRADFARRVFGQEPGSDSADPTNESLPTSLLPTVLETMRSLTKPGDKA